MKKILLIIFSCFSFYQLFSQINDSCINIWQVEVNYSFQMPAGDMKDRFGVNNTIGAGLTFKTRKNWTYGFEVSYLWGNSVKEDSILRNLMTEYGEIINRDGEYGTIRLSESGFYTGVKFGKMFSFARPNRNSGIILNIGGGYLQHKILIENKDNNVPAVIEDYKKGYDRLSSGIALREFIGYQYLSNNRFINFYGGFEFFQSWTRCRRTVNFDTMTKDTKLRHDYLFGIRVGWILPIYKQTPDEFYY